jgi:penicillin-binding protein 1A
VQSARSGNKYEGPVTARYALAQGKNSATARLGFQIGLHTVEKLIRRAGISSKLHSFPRTFLGSSETTLSELTLAYTTFPGLGTRPRELYIIDHITV